MIIKIIMKQKIQKEHPNNRGIGNKVEIIVPNRKIIPKVIIAENRYKRKRRRCLFIIILPHNKF